MVLMISSNLKIHRYFCAMQSFGSSLNIPLSALLLLFARCWMPNKSCYHHKRQVVRCEGEAFGSHSFIPFVRRHADEQMPISKVLNGAQRGRYTDIIHVNAPILYPSCLKGLNYQFWKEKHSDSGAGTTTACSLQQECKNCILYPLQSCTTFTSHEQSYINFWK